MIYPYVQQTESFLLWFWFMLPQHLCQKLLKTRLKTWVLYVDNICSGNVPQPTPTKHINIYWKDFSLQCLLKVINGTERKLISLKKQNKTKHLFIWPCHAARGISVPIDGIRSTAVKIPNPKHWTDRELSHNHLL